METSNFTKLMNGGKLETLYTFQIGNSTYYIDFCEETDTYYLSKDEQLQSVFTNCNEAILNVIAGKGKNEWIAK